MNTRKSPRNQERLWKLLGGARPKPLRAALYMVVSTRDRIQKLSCGHVVLLPPMWSGRPPAQRRCFTCEGPK